MRRSHELLRSSRLAGRKFEPLIVPPGDTTDHDFDGATQAGEVQCGAIGAVAMGASALANCAFAVRAFLTSPK